MCVSNSDTRLCSMNAHTRRKKPAMSGLFCSTDFPPRSAALPPPDRTQSRQADAQQAQRARNRNLAAAAAEFIDVADRPCIRRGVESIRKQADIEYRPAHVRV